MIIKIGTHIGNWEVIGDSYKEGNCTWHLCKCICGLERPVRKWFLNNNKTNGCGCSNIKTRFKAQSVGNLSKSYYTSFKASRISKGKSFDDDVDMEYLWDLYNNQGGKCAISGMNISLNPRWSAQNKGSYTAVIQTASIDRIENSKGYTRGNVQWVHKDVNYMRGSFSVQDFLSICKHVVDNNPDCNSLELVGKSKYMVVNSSGN